MPTVDASTTRTFSPFESGGVEPPARAFRPSSPGAMPTTLSDSPPSGRRILICLDRSTLSEECIPHALSFARTFGSAVSLVHVMEPRHEHPGPQQYDPLAWEISRQEARSYLESVQSRVSEVLAQPVEIRLEQGRAGERIVDLAIEIGASVILLASRGEGGANVSTLGSTASQVLALARTSVFVAPSSPSGGSGPGAPNPRRVLVPLDGSRRAESVLPVAVRIGSVHEAELLLVHVVAEPIATEVMLAAEDMALARALANRLESGAQRYLDRVAEQLSHRVTAVRRLVVRHARESQCLLEVADRERADLVVLSAHGSACDSACSFGGVAGYLLANGAVPVLALQDLPPASMHRDGDSESIPPDPSPRASYAVESV